MNPLEARAAIIAIEDQVRSGFRDYAHMTRMAYDEFVKQGFTPGQAIMLVPMLMHNTRVTYDATT